MVFNVFLSHNGGNSRDASISDIIKNIFRLIPETNVFVAEENIIAGNLSDGLIAQIRQCDLFIVLYSNYSHISQSVQAEIGSARTANKTIIPLLLDRDYTPPIMLQGITYYPIYDNDSWNTHIPRLYEYIKSQALLKSRNEGLALMALGASLLLLAVAISSDS